MALRESSEPLPAPWGRHLRGSLDELVVESELLAGNPLGDSPIRPLYVYRPPGVEAGTEGELPSIYVIQGYFGRIPAWVRREPFEPSVVDRIDAMFASGECPDAVVVFVDAWTAYGGSQFLDSTSTGPYMSYLCDEVVPFIDERYPTAAAAEKRGIAGKSSGGYGAMVVSMMRPDVFRALASHAGDALFELAYVHDFGETVRILRDHYGGSMERFLEELPSIRAFDYGRHGAPLSVYGYAAAYTPDPDHPGKALLPFDVQTGRLVDDVWERWLELDPVRMASSHGDALASMRRIHLDGGRSDEWFLELGAKAFASELDKLGVQHTLEIFDGKHGGIAYRYPGAIRELVVALSGPGA